MYDPADTAKAKKLIDAARASHKELRGPRERRHKAMRSFVGSNYGEGRGVKPVLMNLVQLYVTIYGRSMFARNPKPLFRTKFQQLEPVAAKGELALSNLLEYIGFDKEMRILVENALISVGILKVALSDNETVEIDGVEYPYGQPFAKNVDFDDFFYDICARTWGEMAYCGNKYRVPLDWAKENEAFDAEARFKLKSDKESIKNEAKVSDLSRTNKNNESTEYQEYVDLCDVWLPKERMVVTYAWESGEIPLRVVEWKGPQCGPYHLMSLIDVPNNILPLAPASGLIDLNDAINSAMRKLNRQAQRSKHIFAVQSDAGKDGERTVQSNDGDTIKMDNTASVVPLKFDGPDQMLQTFTLAMYQNFNLVAGNMESVGGLSAQAETLGQDQLISQASGKQLQEMQGRVVDFTAEILRSLAWWMWKDPLREYQVETPIEGTEINIPDVLTPEERANAEFMDLNIDIIPYSLQDTTPQGMMNALLQAWNQVILPGAQLGAQQGIVPNLGEMLEQIAKYGNIPEVKKLVMYMTPQPPSPMDMMGPQKPYSYKKSEPTPRRTLAGANRSGQGAVMSALLNGQGVQPKEMAALTPGKAM